MANSDKALGKILTANKVCEQLFPDAVDLYRTFGRSALEAAKNGDMVRFLSTSLSS